MGHQQITNMLRILIISTLAYLGFAQDCPREWREFQDSCYYLVGTEMDWFSADKYCSLYDPTSYKVHLVSIESSAEQEFLADYALTSGTFGLGYWTSGNRIDETQAWLWARTNTRFRYFNWAPLEPSGNGLCVQMWASSFFQWDDVSCFAIDIGAICEVEKADLVNFVPLDAAAV